VYLLVSSVTDMKHGQFLIIKDATGSLILA